jgi:hypothetical protein
MQKTTKLNAKNQYLRNKLKIIIRQLKFYHKYLRLCLSPYYKTSRR